MKTSKLLTVLSFAASCVLFTACPYSSSVPISDATLRIPGNFIGVWEEDSSSDAKDKVEVKAVDNFKMDIIKTSAYDGTSTTYHGYFSDVAGQTFLNVKDDTDYGSYYFYKVEKDGEFKVKLIEVTPYIRETFENSADLKKFIEANMKNSYFFTTEETTYYKVK